MLLFAEFHIPPPRRAAVLLTSVLSVICKIPWFKTPPPPPLLFVDALPLMTHWFSVKLPLFRMPPPSEALPFEMVNPFIVTVVPLATLKMRKLGVPPAVLRVTITPLPPLIVKFLLMGNSAVVSVTVETPENVIVLPGQARAMASRKLPVPLLAFVVTTGLVTQLIFRL